MVDLTVRGAGIFGLSIAWTALRRGARVRVVDPYGPGAGSSGGVVGAMQPHSPDRWSDKKQFQLESLLQAGDFWRDVESTSGCESGYARVGRLMPLVKDRDVELARSRERDAKLHWQNNALWRVIEHPDTWHPPSPSGFYVTDTLSAILNPRKAIDSLAAAIRKSGGDIVTEAKDQGPTVWATGWKGLSELSHIFDQPVGHGEKGQAALLKFDAAGHPQIYADGLHFVPHLDGTLAIGSTTERYFEAPDATDAALDAILDRARDILPDMAEARVLQRWAGVRPRTHSRAPLLGPWPGRSGHFIANGGFKIGFGMAPKISETLIDLVLKGVDTIPPDFHTNLIRI